MPVLPPTPPSALPPAADEDHLIAAQIMDAYDWCVAKGGDRMAFLLHHIGVDPRDVRQAIINDRWMFNSTDFHIRQLEAMLHSWGGPVMVVRSKLDRARRHVV